MKWCVKSFHPTTSRVISLENFYQTSCVSLSYFRPWSMWRSHDRCGPQSGGKYHDCFSSLQRSPVEREIFVASQPHRLFLRRRMQMQRTIHSTGCWCCCLGCLKDSLFATAGNDDWCYGQRLRSCKFVTEVQLYHWLTSKKWNRRKNVASVLIQKSLLEIKMLVPFSSFLLSLLLCCSFMFLLSGLGRERQE